MGRVHVVVVFVMVIMCMMGVVVVAKDEPPSCSTISLVGHGTEQRVLQKGDMLCVVGTSATSESSAWMWRFLSAPFESRVVAVVDSHGILRYGTECYGDWSDALSTSWLRSWTGGITRFSPHETQCFTCVGGSSAGGSGSDSPHSTSSWSGSTRPYQCTLNISQRVETWSLIQAGAALLVCLLAPRVVRYNFFIYVMGFVFGMVFALLLVLYFTLRKTTNLQNLAVMSTAAFLAQSALMWYFHVLLQQYLHITLSFFFIFGCIGFAVIYRLDLSERDKKLLSWCMQGVAVAFAYFAFPRSILPLPLSMHTDPTAVCVAVGVAAAPIVLGLVQFLSSIVWGVKGDDEAQLNLQHSPQQPNQNRHRHHRRSHGNDDDDEGDGGEEHNVVPEEANGHAGGGGGGGFFHKVGIRNRGLMARFFTERLGEERSSDYIVRGAQPYMSMREYEQTGIAATTQGEDELLREFLNSPERYSAVLSPAARVAMSRLAAAHAQRDHE